MATFTLKFYRASGTTFTSDIKCASDAGALYAAVKESGLDKFAAYWEVEDIKNYKPQLDQAPA